MRLPRPTHRSLIVGAGSAVAALAVVVGLVLLHVLVSAMADAALDDTLDDRATRLARAAADGDDLAVTTDPYAQVVGADGTVVTRSETAPEQAVLSDPQLLRALGDPVSYDRGLPGLGDTARVRTAPVPGAEQVVVVATSRDTVDLLTSRHLHVVLVLVPLLVLAVAAGASRMVQESLRPLTWLRDEAEGAAKGRRRSVRVPPGEDEVAGLAQALDLMLGRVREVEDREHTFVEDATRGLNTPVSVLKGELRHALTLTDQDEIRRSLRLSAAEAERIATLTTDLLVLAHARGGTLELDLEEADLREAVVRATKALRTALGVEVEVEGERVRARFDRLRLEQCITYLVANSAAAGASHVHVHVRDVGPAAEIAVADDGPGFPADLLPGALDPFTRADGPRAPRTAGAGLGLAVVDAVAAAHDGEVTVDNASDLGGARVVVRLPFASTGDRSTTRQIEGSSVSSLTGASA